MSTYDSDSQLFWKDGLKFSCTSCGHCCRHEPGYVFLSENDLSRLAAHHGMKPKKFAAKYCRRVDLGLATRLSLLETAVHDCIFWDGGCTVYEARPLQCRTYPFWPAIVSSPIEWENEAKECPGMNSGKLRSADDIRKALDEREEDSLISL